MKTMRTLTTVCAAVLCMALWQSCAVNPVTGRKQVAFMSEEQEIATGRQSDPQIIAQYGLYDDPKLQEFIQQKGMEMARISHRPNLDWKFRVLDSDVINAFAVPGGYVYFTRGILAHMNNEAQFAGVLGHEIGHVTARHSVSQQTKGIFTQLGVLAAVVVSPEMAQMADQLSQGAQLLMLSYSRADESQSDELGVQYSSQVGYDAREMAKFFLTLQASSKAQGGGSLPEFMSTHPDPGNRFQRVTQLAQQFQKNNNLNVSALRISRQEYLNRISGIVYGQDPRQGFVQNGVFYHPQLRFQFATPQGWQYQNTPSRVLFVAPQGNAMCFLTLAKGSTAKEAAQAFQQQNKLQIQDARETTINGLPAAIIVGDQVQQTQQGGQQTIRAVATFLQQNGRVYQWVGVAAPQNFNQYFGLFQQQYNSFRTLTDQRIINTQPERIALHTVKKAGSFQQQLTTLGIPAARTTELSILNGFNASDNLPVGTIIKYPKRG